MNFHFLPGQPFGVAAGGGLTATRTPDSRVLFNANSGEHTIESKQPLRPLEVRIIEELNSTDSTTEQLTRTIRLTGQTLSVSQRFDSQQDLDDMITAIFFGLPISLNVGFADPPFVERVDGTVGESSFRWELESWRMAFQLTSQEEQEEKVVKAWRRLGLITASNRRRLMAGLHYFHVACRLAREGRTPGEFLAEVILNLSKTLEVLFPPADSGKTRDPVRIGLASIEYSSEEIERDFLPAMALRNEIDVGHVELGVFTMEQLKIIHAFTERAEDAFHRMFERLLIAIETGKVDVATYTLGSPRKEAIQLIERLQKSMVNNS